VELNEERSSPAIMLTEEQFVRLLEGRGSRRETRIIERTSPQTSSDGSTRSSTLGMSTCPEGFARCSARFDGRDAAGRRNEKFEAFLDAILTYKECISLSDEHALRGLSMLLVEDAALWWQGVKATTPTWEEAVRRMKRAYGTAKPAHALFAELFKMKQGEASSENFVNRIRALLARVPYEICEAMKVDIAYALINDEIKERTPRDQLASLDQLIERANHVEDAVKSSSKRKEDQDPMQERKATRCANCRGWGHLARQCTQETGKKKGTIDPKPAATHEEAPEESKPFACYGCGTLGVIRSRCPRCTAQRNATITTDAAAIEVTPINVTPGYVTVGIDGGEERCLLDSCASRNITSTKSSGRKWRFSDGPEKSLERAPTRETGRSLPRLRAVREGQERFPDHPTSAGEERRRAARSLELFSSPVKLRTIDVALRSEEDAERELAQLRQETDRMLEANEITPCESPRAAPTVLVPKKKAEWEWTACQEEAFSTPKTLLTSAPKLKQALKWLMQLKSPTGRLARWARTLQPFNLKEEYIPGRANRVADTLSRPPEEPIKDEIQLYPISIDLPTQGRGPVRRRQQEEETAPILPIRPKKTA
jgi:hypothetical protein